MVLLIIVTMLHIRSLEFIHFISESFYPLTNIFRYVAFVC